MSYLVQNISGKIQTKPKRLETLNHDINNWAVGQIDTVDDDVIDLYTPHTDAFTVLAGPNLYATPGSVPAASVTAGATSTDTETGLNRTTLTLTSVSVATTDAGASGAYGSFEMYNFPEGLIAIVAATTNLTIARVGTAITTTAAVVGAVGSVAAAADATLTSTEADIVPSTVSTLTAGAGVTKGKSTAAVILDGTATAAKAYLNFAMPDAGSTGNDALLVNGTVTILWSNAGDN